MGISRKRFALLDISDNYSFSFVSGIGDSDVYPGKLIMELSLLYRPSLIECQPSLQIVSINLLDHLVFMEVVRYQYNPSVIQTV